MRSNISVSNYTSIKYFKISVSHFEICSRLD